MMQTPFISVMSVDKFGRSSASIVRRSASLPPSRRALESAGVLCMSDEHVDFKTAIARNIGTPIESMDATTKEYVDQSVQKVHAAAQQTVVASLEQVIKSTHALTQEYVTKKLQSYNIAFKLLIAQDVEKTVADSEKKVIDVVQERTRERIEERLESFYDSIKVHIAQGVRRQIKDDLETITQSLDATKTALQRYLDNSQLDSQAAIQETVKANNRAGRLEEDIKSILERISALEQQAPRRTKPRNK